jgi:homospermidine synthase
MKFTNNILIIGCGSVAQCTIPLIIRHLAVKPSQITVIDFTDNHTKIPEGIRYITTEVTKANLSSILGKYLKKGDLVIDLAWNIGTIDLLTWCKDHEVICVNTAVELWEPFINHPPEQKTLYFRHMGIRKEIKSWKEKNTTTAILDHGANPGLISSIAKQGLIDIADQILKGRIESTKRRSLVDALKKQDFAKIAHLIGLKTIHISERDSQKPLIHKRENEFVNTWSVVGFYEEGIAPSELGWGTHEKGIPAGAKTHAVGPQNQIFLDSYGIDNWVESWVPSGPIRGMVVRHGEAFSLSEFLTYKENGKVVYRPTVHYAYHPCDDAVQSLEELKARNLRLQDNQRIFAEEITEGKDELGCLFLGHDLGGWWTGSVLDIDESRALVPHQNATTVQVAIGVIAAIIYCIKNPREGVCLPEHLPHDFVLEIAKPYLGEFLSIPTTWRPSRQKEDKGNWQFEVFRCAEKVSSLSTYLHFR